MAWVTFNRQSVLARMSSEESQPYEEETGNSAAFNTLDEIISQVTAMVRGKVLACKANLSGIGPSGTIPSECVHAAATLARLSFIAVYPTGGDSTLREKEMTAANSFMDAVASCSVAIEGGGSEGGSFPGSSPVSFGGSPLLDFRQ